ncbi:hypothetical protein [Cohnella herbarum]|uniref:Uncharacterized protein n=1 Tax=Cohnella herbarum TaxID=2728023 RepID=A0A7Z2ZQN7_9BACL|nr:hypothetical protein [Cohnella herbarum]QJD87232.1 hypothetical protein HH215_31340 [Cohnella herbarum]
MESDSAYYSAGFRYIDSVGPRYRALAYLRSTERSKVAHKWEDPFVRRKTNPSKRSGTAAAYKPVVSSLKRRRAFCVIRQS